MKPEFRNRDEEIAQKTSDEVVKKVGVLVDERIRPLQDKIDSIDQSNKDKKVDKNIVNTASDVAKNRIKKIIEDAKRAKKEREISINDLSIDKSDIKKENGEHYHKFDCPTCHNHDMKIEPKSLIAKCTGPDCNEQFVLVNKKSDYKCTNCGIPIKKPEKEQNLPDNCPFCGNDKAKQFDWNFVKKL